MEATPPITPQPPPDQPGQPPAAPAPASDRLADWPQKGGVGVQPWEHRELGIDVTACEEGGHCDQPIVPDHARPILAPGSQGEAVRELAQRLDFLGYPSSITKGENPFDLFDATVSSAAAAFCRDYDVQEDPTPFGGTNPSGVAQASNHVGPWVWAAVIRASDRQKAQKAA